MDSRDDQRHGERAGNADIAEIALALHCVYGVPIEFNLERIREVSSYVCRTAGYQLEAWKPVVGENLFIRESGAVASQFHIPEAIEPFSADLVGATRGIVLGKKSGLDSIDLKCRELGIALAPEMRAPVLTAVKKQAVAQRGLVSNEQFRTIIASVASAGVAARAT